MTTQMHEKESDRKESTYSVTISQSRIYDPDNKEVVRSVTMSFVSGFTLVLARHYGDEPLHGRSRTSVQPSTQPDLWVASLYRPGDWQRGNLHCQQGRGEYVWNALAALDLGDDAFDVQRSLLQYF